MHVAYKIDSFLIITTFKQNMNSSKQEEASMCKERAFRPVQSYITTQNKVIIVPIAGKPTPTNPPKNFYAPTQQRWNEMKNGEV